MTENRPYAGWLRSLAGLVALAGVLGLSACGGGSGAPNNPFNPSPGTAPLTVLPGDSVAYSGIPTTLTISGGTPPYNAFSSNSAVLPVTQAVPGSTIVLLAGNVSADTPVTVTVQDSSGGAGTTTPVPVTVTVRAAPLVNSLTITPNFTDCGTTAICSGQTGTASVTVQGPQGGPIAGRLVRFDVVAGPFLITTTNPAQPLVTSLTVVSDANGVASVIIKANVDAPTQFAQISATDLTSGQRLVGNFLIQQVTDGTKILSVVPGTAKITGAFKGECSTGFITDYHIFGGTPPYSISSSFSTSIVLQNAVVAASGGFFRAITNGSCVDPVTFSILDATGRLTTATLSNVEGTADRPTVPTVPPEPIAIAPPTVNETVSCAGQTYTFIASGGTGSYGAIVSPSPPAAVLVTGKQVKVSALVGPGNYVVTVFDNTTATPATATILCP